MKRILLILCALFLLCGCEREVRTQYYLMDTVMSFSLFGADADEAERAVADEVARLERVFSPTREDSELYAINLANTPMQVSPTFAELLRISLSAAEETEGAFDPTLGSVIALWKRGAVPHAEELAEQVTGAEEVHLEGETVTLGGVKLDFGAVAKGYASDRAKEILDTYQIKRALLSLGGNLYVRGTKSDGKPYLVGVRDPNGEAEDWLGLLSVSDAFVIASGDYERYFEENGVRYHHLLDAQTLSPATSDLREVVIVCDSGTRGDILSTALFVMGRERAQEYWRERRDFEFILVGADNTVTVSAGLEDAFSLTEAAYRLEVAQ